MTPERPVEVDASPNPAPGLEDALADWLELTETDFSPDEATFLSRYPHLSDVLKAHLADWRKVHALTRLIPADKVATDPGGSPGAIDQTAGFLDETQRSGEVIPLIPGYGIDSELGRGGMGIVYKARQMRLARWVAIKMLRNRSGNETQESARFKNEAAIIAQLDHPNIVPIFEIGEHEGRLFFAMKWIEGGSLAEQLRRHPEQADPAAQRRTAELLVAVARAVHYAHQRGVLHRDLKPSNVLLGSAGCPYVTDFGLAKRLDDESETTQTGEFVGTPSYMAPEQASGKKNAVTTATDVHGLGALLYALLTGRAPFQGEGVMQTLELVKEREPEEPIHINPSVDRDLQTICLKCLQKDPDRRYLSAEALAEDLERWLAGEPIVARPTTTGERLTRWVRRRPAIAALIGLSCAAVVALITGLLIYNHNIGIALADADKLRIDGLKREANLRRHLYVADVRAARQYLDSGNDAEALELLNRYVPETDQEDLRGFEWHQMHATCTYKPRILGKHDAPALCLAASPNDRWLATGDKAGVIKIWDLHEGKEVRVLPGPKQELTSLRFSPDGRFLAAAVRQEWQIRLWEVDTWKEKASLHGFFCTVRGVAFSPDSSHLAAALIDSTVRIWKLGANFVPTTLNLPAHKEVLCVDWSPDGKQLLATGRDGTASIWDVAAKKEAFPLPKVSTATILSGVFHPHRPLVATAGYRRRVSIWDLPTRTESAGHLTTGAVRALTFAPDGKSLAAVGEQGEIYLLHLPSDRRGHRVCRVYRDGNASIRGVAYLHQGRTLVTAAEDGFVKKWDVARLSSVKVRQHDFILRGLSEDGRFVATRAGAIPKLTVFNTATFKPLGHVEEFVSLTRPVFSPSGRSIAFVTPEGKLHTRDVKTFQQRIDFAELRGTPIGMAFSPDEEHLIIGEQDGTIRIWNARRGTFVATLHEGKAKARLSQFSFRFSPDGKTLISSPDDNDSEIVVWDFDRRARRTTLRAAAPGLFSLAMSRDGHHLAAGVGERLIQIWDLNTGQLQATLVGNTDRVDGVAFSPDGQTLASACDDGNIKLWHLPTGQPLFTLHACRMTPFHLAFDELGRTLTAISNGADESELLTWTLPAPR